MKLHFSGYMTTKILFSGWLYYGLVGVESIEYIKLSFMAL